MTNYDILKEYEAHKTPVPSYEEWVGVKQQRDLENKLRHDSDNKNWQLRTENAKLKELLKECKGIFDECFSPSVKYGELYKQIDEVLK